MAFPRSLAAALLLLLGAPLLVGCGCSHCHYTGDLYLWNRTDTTTNENVLTFVYGIDGDPYGGNVLPMPLIPGDQDFLVTLDENVYDGEATLQLGGIVDFFNFFVGNYDNTVLQVF
jgi:hypothetical protein